MIIDIRGTHGSGKSSIPIALIKLHDAVPILGKPLTYEGKVGILGYEIGEYNLKILGRYETQCGGCDGIKTQDEIKARIKAWEGESNLMLEGILVSHTFGPWNEFAEHRDWRFRFLSTDLQTCIARVNARRAASGKGPLDDPKNIVKDWSQIRSLQPKFQANGHDSKWLTFGAEYPEIITLLEQANEQRHA